MKLKKADIEKALEIVKPGLSNNEIIEQSTSFAFRGDQVITYNDSISLSHQIKGLDITGAIRAEQLYEFLKRSKNDNIELIISENELKMKCGRAKAGLTFEAEVVLPLDKIDDKEGWEDIPEDFTDNLMFIRDMCSRDMSRRVLTCVNVTNNFIESSDGFQIIRLYEEGSWPFGDTLIPGEVISDIHKIKPVKAARADNWVHFQNANGTELSCRILNDTYPDASDHFVVEGEKVIFPKSINEILDRAMVFTEKDHFMDEELEVRLEKNKLTVAGKNKHGWFEEVAPVKYKGPGATFWITPSVLQSISTRSTSCVLGKEKIRFEGDNWEYIAVLKQKD